VHRPRQCTVWFLSYDDDENDRAVVTWPHESSGSCFAWILYNNGMSDWGIMVPFWSPIDKFEARRMVQKWEVCCPKLSPPLSSKTMDMVQLLCAKMYGLPAELIKLIVAELTIDAPGGLIDPKYRRILGVYMKET